MFHSKPRRGMVGKHALLRPDNPLDGDRARGRQVRNVAQVIDHVAGMTRKNSRQKPSVVKIRLSISASAP